ncbi:hypothetical protein BCR35DRAFT_308347 [Leucosporidium creatinivorum]|uniref:Uncharacterized protein n=1 Tax=Leucosporidium creatinivorum TaxID=106004 RepID=A0A1Y2E639_9BASI|nr:hypothetical protein BCR35DRAFT_308347 [Leucosporidium creatinivorum]
MKQVSERRDGCEGKGSSERSVAVQQRFEDVDPTTDADDQSDQGGYQARSQLDSAGGLKIECEVQGKVVAK